MSLRPFPPTCRVWWLSTRQCGPSRIARARFVGINLLAALELSLDSAAISDPAASLQLPTIGFGLFLDLDRVFSLANSAAHSFAARLKVLG